MPRYIDANKLICDIDGSECLDTERDYEEVARRIDECETADVEEVRHGEWNYIPETDFTCAVYECSVCKTYQFSPHTQSEYQYCPNCGAKMDGRKK